MAAVMAQDNSESSESFDLGRYRQAADVAYRYAKNKIEKERTPSKAESQDPFGKEDKQET